MIRKKNRISLNRQEIRLVWIAMGLVVIVGGLSAGLGAWLVHKYVWQPAVAKELGADGLKLPTADLRRGDLQIFSYPIDSARLVQFFVRKQREDDVQVALAGCRRCYKSGIGLRNGDISCGLCRERMQVMKPGEVPSSDADCTEILLPYEKESGQLIVRGQAIKNEFQKWIQPVLDRR